MSILKINGSWIVLVTLTKLLTLCNSLSCRNIQLIRSGIEEAEKQSILSAHNRLREYIASGHVPNQPPAANMQEMKWDERLAARAQQWALCGVREHDAHRHTTQDFVGQNMASTWTTRTPKTFADTKPDFWKDAIAKWFNEHNHYHLGHYTNIHTGHYTQIAWADSNSVGCGFAFYYDPSRGYTKNYVCNYAPSGNVIGELPYETGYPNCYSYGLTGSKNYHGLCDKPGTHYGTTFAYSSYFG